MKVLVADDDADLRELIAFTLTQSGYLVLKAGDGPSAVRRFEEESPDLVVLDINMPGLSGFQVCEAIRERSRIPVMMLTVRGEEEDLVRALGLGADDYLTKPFSPKELVARVRSVLRRTEAAQAPGDMIRVGDVELNVPSMELAIAGQRIELTPTEFQLLATMARQPGRVFSRAQLLNAVHGDAGEAFERAIDAHIKNVRRKIEPDPHNPRYLLTVFGVGYRFADVRR